MHKIWFNGEGYPDAEAMPPDVRRQYEAAIERRAKAENSPASEVVRMGVWEDDGDGKLEVHTSREIIINGKKYSDLEQLPPSERELVQRMMGRFPDLLGEPPDFLDDLDGGGSGEGSFLENGWAVALVLALALFWVLMFGK